MDNKKLTGTKLYHRATYSLEYMDNKIPLALAKVYYRANISLEFMDNIDSLVLNYLYYCFAY